MKSCEICVTPDFTQTAWESDRRRKQMKATVTLEGPSPSWLPRLRIVTTFSESSLTGFAPTNPPRARTSPMIAPVTGQVRRCGSASIRWQARVCQNVRDAVIEHEVIGGSFRFGLNALDIAPIRKRRVVL